MKRKSGGFSIWIASLTFFISHPSELTHWQYCVQKKFPYGRCFDIIWVGICQLRHKIICVKTFFFNFIHNLIHASNRDVCRLCNKLNETFNVTQLKRSRWRTICDAIKSIEGFLCQQHEIAEFNWRLCNVEFHPNIYPTNIARKTTIILQLFALIVVPIPSVCYSHIRPKCKENRSRWGEEKSIKQIKQRRTIIDGFSTEH